jgi:hypothetical protein
MVKAPQASETNALIRLKRNVFMLRKVQQKLFQSERHRKRE